MTVIIGIDPGSRYTGYGVIQLKGNRHIYLDSGRFDLTTLPFGEKLRHIFINLQNIIKIFQPQEAAIEQVFMKDNPHSALKLGQARGAAIVALDMPLAEYSAREIKKSVTGHGGANKEQIQYMVKRLLNLKDIPVSDAADALAVALCHAQVRNFNQWISQHS